MPAGLLSSNQDLFIPFWVDKVNLSLSTSCMDGLKTGTLIPLIKELNKTTDVENSKNYRPVTNLPFLSKLVERVVQIRLNKHMSNNNLVDHNFAYRKAHSTELLLLKVINDLYSSFDHNMPSMLVLLDLSAAFDTVDHDKLINILDKQIGVEGPALLCPMKWT